MHSCEKDSFDQVCVCVDYIFIGNTHSTNWDLERSGITLGKIRILIDLVGIGWPCSPAFSFLLGLEKDF